MKFRELFKRKIFFIGITICILVLGGLFYSYSRQKDLNSFAKTYAEFRSAQVESDLDSYVPIVDTEKEDYFDYLKKALDVHTTNAIRKENAERAIDYYNSFTQRSLDHFEEKNVELNQKTLLLIESAGGIKNREYRDKALEITRYAREIQSTYERLRSKYYERFKIQLDIMEKLISKNGDIHAITNDLQEGATKIPEITNEINKLRDELDAVNKKLLDSYSYFKGLAGFKDSKASQQS